MIKLNWLDDIIELVLCTARIKNGKIVSLMIVANPESGKTDKLMTYKDNIGVKTLTDFTAYGVRRDLIEKIREGKIKFLFIPDMIKIIGKNQSVSNDALTLINSLIEEGYATSATYHEKFEEGKIPAKCGIISSITPEFMKKRTSIVSSTGFMSRFLCLEFEYSSPDVKKIIDYGFSDESTEDEKPIKVPVSGNLMEVKINSDNLDLREVKNEIYKITSELNKKNIILYGFRLTKMLNMLMKANAFIRNDNKVTQEDVDKIHSLMKHIYRG